MVRDSDAPQVQAVGDVFVVNMHNDDFGDYQMRNEVVAYEEDSVIIWAPGRYDIDEETWNHRWGWFLTPSGDATETTAFFDGTRVPEEGRRMLKGGEVWRPVLERSLEKIQGLVAR